MAMDADVLEQQILDIFVTESELQFARVVKGVNITEVPYEDGTSKYDVELQYGPIEVDVEKSRPLAKAIARAVVDHIARHAQVADIGPGAGTWRIT